MSPQKEDGYTPIANELFEAFYRCKMEEYERCVVMCIWRKTYGWSKKEDWVSLSQLNAETGIAIPNISRTIKQLISKGVVVKSGKKISVNKKWKEWKIEWRIDMKKLSHQITKVISPDNKKLSHQITTKEKRNYTKASNPPTVNKEIYIDYETGEKKEVPRKSNTPRSDIIALVNLFQEMGEKATGVRPDVKSGYFKVIKAMKEHNLSTEDVKNLYKYFFGDSKMSDEKKVSLGLCISGAYITQWKVAQKNKPISQVDASSEIYL